MPGIQAAYLALEPLMKRWGIRKRLAVDAAQTKSYSKISWWSSRQPEGGADQYFVGGSVLNLLAESYSLWQCSLMAQQTTTTAALDGIIDA